ncbi:XdhC family protein [Streptomyces griseofuscus]|uniref:XdhC family protein n=1 Tax=Streptomyces griseofuscus TaxID=146922 RepID=UPI0036749D6B
MRDIAQGLSSWSASGKRFAVATVVRTWKSAPRQAGSSLAVAEDGEVIGSVSGGCVEGAVYELASEVLESGQAALVTYGVSDDDALAVGLTCGGIIEILVRPAGAGRFPGLPGVLEAMDAGRPVAVVSPLPDEGGGAEPDPTAAPAGQMIVTPSGAQGTLGDPRLDAAVVERAQGLLAQGSTGVMRVGRAGEERRDDVAVFVESFAPPPRMLVFGAIDFASAVARIGKFLGYHVTLCDARPVFATRRRFPDADELVVDWPHRYLESTEVDGNTVICVLTHDPKFDVPLLQRALRTPARYIGAMGSRRTHEDRLRRLREEGMTEAELSRLSAPIGLDLGARTPEETAVAIMAEVIALRWGGTGRRLVEMTPLPIHR